MLVSQFVHNKHKNGRSNYPIACSDFPLFLSFVIIFHKNKTANLLRSPLHSHEPLLPGRVTLVGGTNEPRQDCLPSTNAKTTNKSRGGGRTSSCCLWSWGRRNRRPRLHACSCVCEEEGVVVDAEGTLGEDRKSLTVYSTRQCTCCLKQVRCL